MSVLEGSAASRRTLAVSVPSLPGSMRPGGGIAGSACISVVFPIDACACAAELPATPCSGSPRRSRLIPALRPKPACAHVDPVNMPDLPRTTCTRRFSRRNHVLARERLRRAIVPLRHAPGVRAGRSGLPVRRSSHRHGVRGGHHPGAQRADRAGAAASPPPSHRHVTQLRPRSLGTTPPSLTAARPASDLVAPVPASARHGVVCPRAVLRCGSLRLIP